MRIAGAEEHEGGQHAGEAANRSSGGNNYDKGELKPFALPDTAPDALGQLYNLETNPSETTNLSFKHPELVKELKALLDASKTSGHTATRDP